MPDPNEPTDALETQDNAPVQEPISTPEQSTAPESSDAKEISQTTSSESGDQDANKKPSSLLDAVKRAAHKSADESSSNSETNGKSAEGTGNPTPSLDDAAKEKSTPEADKKLPFHNHPRWKEMIAERDAYRTESDEFRKVTTFMSANGLSTEEVAEGFQIMALMKTNPAEAHKRISEYKSRLDAFVGATLPPEIQKKVEEGYVDEESAKELAMLKAQHGLYQQQQINAMQQREQNARGNIHSAVVGWEQQMRVKDPDWSAKQEMVIDQVKLMLQAEKPTTPEEALALVERAHSTIKERLSRFAPQRRPVNHVSSSTSSANATAQPRSLLEAVRLGAMQTR
jgi:hypothetical protein